MSKLLHSYWLIVLESAPGSRSAPATQPRAALSSARGPRAQQQACSKPGDRRNARLVDPDAADQALPPDENPAVDIEPSDAGLQEDRNIVAVDPLDNPIPMLRKKPRKDKPE